MQETDADRVGFRQGVSSWGSGQRDSKTRIENSLDSG